MFPAVFLLNVVAVAALNGCAPTVAIPNGKIQGGRCANTTSNQFLAIPYAEPPLGELRFEPPQPFNRRFNGTFQATTAAPNCIQFGTTGVEDGPTSEDCLFLDIWAPQNATARSKFPVKVWLYGGSAMTGSISDPLYNGCNIADDAIVVSINYRLGPLGYLALQTAGLSGNYGLQDQLLGLNWVKNHIAAFGGDPTKILLFGESTGAYSTFAISTLPQAPELINAAAMESGGGVDFATVAQAEQYNELFVSLLNCSKTDVDCLRSKSTSELGDAVNNMPSDGVPVIGTPYTNEGRGMSWGPLIDGKVIPAAPSQVGVKVPSIMGSNTNEGSLFVLSQYGLAAFNLTSAAYDQFLEYNFGPFASTVNQTYALSKFSASPVPVFTAMSTVYTACKFHCTAHRGLDLAAQNGVPVYTYSFNHTPSCSWESAIPNNATIRAALGATHTSEIPFVFGAVDNLPPPSGNCSFNAAEKDISDFMVNAWTSMAANGSPGIDWPIYTRNESAGVNVGSSEVDAGQVDYSVCTFWDALQGAMMTATADNLM